MFICPVHTLGGMGDIAQGWHSWEHTLGNVVSGYTERTGKSRDSPHGIPKVSTR